MHLPGVLSPQPWPSQTPDEHSSPARQLAPSAFLLSFGGGVLGGVGSTSWTEPGSVVAGGVWTGSGGRVSRGAPPGQPARSASSKIVVLMRASYTRVRGIDLRRALSRDDLRRVTRAGARCRRRWLPAAHADRRRADPGRA